MNYIMTSMVFLLTDYKIFYFIRQLIGNVIVKYLFNALKSKWLDL